MKTKSKSSSSKSNSSQFSLPNFNLASLAVAAAIFLLGIGAGIAFSSTASYSSENMVSTNAIDRSVPDAELCQQYGASAVVTDMRVFMTMNPFSVYVDQPAMQPGCVMRRPNWSILERRNLVSSEQVHDCKQRMNTFGFTGKLENSPKISCIYQNDSAGDFFRANKPGGAPSPENDDF